MDNLVSYPGGDVSCGLCPRRGVDDAKAQLAQKNYEAVDKILSQDLAVRTPSAEALRVSLAAAIEAGKPVTAESRLVVLLKQQQDPHLLLTGAKIAEILSDEPLALTRYLAYARAETQKQEALESALAYVLKRDGYLEEFRKYVETFGATDRAWGLAEMQWRHFAGHRDGEQLLALADYLMQKWPDPARSRSCTNGSIRLATITSSAASRATATGGRHWWRQSTSRPTART